MPDDDPMFGIHRSVGPSALAEAAGDRATWKDSIEALRNAIQRSVFDHGLAARRDYEVMLRDAVRRELAANQAPTAILARVGAYPFTIRIINEEVVRFYAMREFELDVEGLVVVGGGDRSVAEIAKVFGVPVAQVRGEIAMMESLPAKLDRAKFDEFVRHARVNEVGGVRAERMIVDDPNAATPLQNNPARVARPLPPVPRWAKPRRQKSLKPGR